MCPGVVLSEKELNKVENLKDNFFLADLILPISRVKTIYFKNAEQAKKTVWNIESGAAFLPDELVKIDNNSRTTFTGNLSNLRIESPEPTVKNEEKVILFDRLMGGFALMQIGGEDWQDYCENYIATLSLLNQKILETWKDGGEIGDRDMFEWLIFEKMGIRNLANMFFQKLIMKF